MHAGLIRMEWRDALFAHWPVDPATLDARLPDGIRPRTHDGRAWLGIVAFVMTDIRPRGLPRVAGLTFGEANLRTYVAGPDGGEGIYFFNLDAADPIGVRVARRLYRLPYYRATMRITRSDPLVRPAAKSTSERPRDETGRRVDFASNRIHPGVPDAHLDVSYGPLGQRFVAESGSLEAFFVENYRFYLAGGDVRSGESPDGRREADVETESPLFAGDVAHDPWPLYRADLDLLSTNFFAVNGFDPPAGAPIAHYSPGVDVTAGAIRRVD